MSISPQPQTDSQLNFQDDQPLPPGWIKKWDQVHQVWSFIDTRQNPPVTTCNDPRSSAPSGLPSVREVNRRFAALKGVQRTGSSSMKSLHPKLAGAGLKGIISKMTGLLGGDGGQSRIKASHSSIKAWPSAKARISTGTHSACHMSGRSRQPHYSKRRQSHGCHHYHYDHGRHENRDALSSHQYSPRQAQIQGLVWGIMTRSPH